MEEKSEIKISLKTLLLFIAIIVIIIMSCFAYKFYIDKENERNKIAELNKIINDVNEKNENLENEKKELIEKDEDDKNIEFTTIVDRKEDSRIINPYGTEEWTINCEWELLQINFDSEDAKAVNEKLKADYEKAVNSLYSTYNYAEYKSIDYEVSCANGILSILVTSLFNPIVGGDTLPSYEVYNFDINTEKLLSVDETLEKIGLTRDWLDNKIKEKEKQFYTSIMLNHSGGDYVKEYGSTFEEYYGKFNFEDLKCYIYSSKKIKVIYKAPSDYGVVNTVEEFEYDN